MAREHASSAGIPEQYQVHDGRWRAPRNRGLARPGTVQETDTARRRGFEAAVVAAATHLEQFVPLVTEHFGDVWWRRGGISLHTVATAVEQEPVRCYLQPLDPEHARVWMNAEGESLVLAGTAGLGEDARSALRARLRRVRRAAHLRLLDGVRPGDESAVLPMRIDSAAADARLPAVTEPVACYRRGSDFGGRVAPLGLTIAATRAVERELAPAAPAPMEAFGGLELSHVHGPVLCDRDYSVRGRVLTVTASRYTEILWYEAEIRDAQDLTLVARVLRMNRVMEDA